jgi:hypothetical protein
LPAELLATLADGEAEAGLEPPELLLWPEAVPESSDPPVELPEPLDAVLVDPPGLVELPPPPLPAGPADGLALADADAEAVEPASTPTEVQVWVPPSARPALHSPVWMLIPSAVATRIRARLMAPTMIAYSTADAPRSERARD